MIPKHARILVVDDEPDVLFALKLLLKSEVREVVTEKNPELLLSLLRQQHFDVVLLDMNYRSGQATGNEGFYWLGRIREHVDAARARLRPRTTYEICGQSEGTVLAVFQTPAERRVPWMRRLVEDCTRAGIGDRYEILAAPARKALP